MIKVGLASTGDVYRITPKGQLQKLNGVYIIFNKEPFSEGTFRIFYLGFLVDKQKKNIKLDDIVSGKCVIKLYKTIDNIQNDLKGDLTSSFIANAYAAAFNNIIKIPNKINFVNPLATVDTNKQVIVLEPFIEGQYTRFSNNFGYENKDYNAYIPAFSHYTWLCSKGRLVINDIQGVFNNGKYILTDPAIQSVEKKYAGSDIGCYGLIVFLATHKHNDICKNWTWIPMQLQPALGVFAGSIKRTSFNFEHKENIIKYLPIYIGLIKYIFK